MPYGAGLVYKACKLIVRFVGLYYTDRKYQYTLVQQGQIENLTAAANALLEVLSPTMGE